MTAKTITHARFRSSIHASDEGDSSDERISLALEEYCASQESGQPLSRESLLAKYSDVADELIGCLDSLDFMRQVAPQLSDVTPDTRDGVSAKVHGPVNLGDFRIVRELGRGGMGVVYEAEQLSLGRRVALKVLPFAAMLDKQQLARFKNEARAAATLDHPNIVAIHSVGSERGVHYYAMQLIEGRSLAEIIADLKPGRSPSAEETSQLVAPISHPMAADTVKAALPTHCSSGSAAFSTIPPFSSSEYFRTIARLGIQAADALDHAHQSGILHRDIKPANLLVDDTGKLWIADFGLARIEADAGMTMTGNLLGTLRYMSPEQALANRVIVDHRSDVYSLGVTLYELLTLHPTYTGNNQQELLRQIAFEEPRKPRQINVRVPPDLETIVLKAIEKNPTDRFATAHEFAADLRRFLDDHPIHARRPTLTQHTRKWLRRHQAIAMVATTAAMLVVLLATMYLTDRWRQHREGQDFVVHSVTTARAALEADDLKQASQRIGEARTRIEANGLNDPTLANQVAVFATELDRYSKFRELLSTAHDNIGHSEQITQADEALALYHVMDDADWLNLLKGMNLPEAHVKRLSEDVFELLLLKAYDLTLFRNTSAKTTREAIAHLNKAISFHPATRGYYWLLANYYLTLPDQKKASELRQQALQTPPHDASELLYISLDRRHGAVAESMGYPNYSIDECARDCRDMLRLDPSYYNGLFFLALGLQNNGKYDESLLAWYACAALRPNYVGPKFHCAGIHEQLGHYREAVADWQSLTSAQPDNVAALNALAWLLATVPDETLRDGPRALKLAERACDLSNSAPSVMDTLAAAYAETGDFKSAVKWSEKSLARGESPLSKAEQAELQNHLESFRKGAAWREPSGKSDIPLSNLALEEYYSTESLAAQASDRLKKGEVSDELVKAIDEVLTKFPAPRAWWGNRGGLEPLVAQSDEVFQKLIALRPNDRPIYIARVNYFASQRRWTEAADSLKTVIQLDPTEKWGWFNAATVYMYIGNMAEYERVRNETAKRFENETNPNTAAKIAKACLLAPADRTALATPRRLAEFALSRGPGKAGQMDWIYLVNAKSEYRSGDFESSIQSAQCARELRSATSLFMEPTALLIEAMAQHRLGKTNQSRELLAAAERSVDQDSAYHDQIQVTEMWHTRLRYEILHREAESLFATTEHETTAPQKP